MKVKRKYPVLLKASFTRSIKKYLYDKENKIKSDIIVKTKKGESFRVYTNIAWRDNPKNSAKPISLIEFDEKPLTEKIKEVKEKIKINADSGYEITLDWLYLNFNEKVVNELTASGQLCKDKNGIYKWCG